MDCTRKGKTTRSTLEQRHDRRFSTLPFPAYRIHRYTVESNNHAIPCPRTYSSLQCVTYATARSDWTNTKPFYFSSRRRVITAPPRGEWSLGRRGAALPPLDVTVEYKASKLLTNKERSVGCKKTRHTILSSSFPPHPPPRPNTVGYSSLDIWNLALARRVWVLCLFIRKDCLVETITGRVT